MLKSIPSQILALTRPHTSRRNLRVLFRFLLVLLGLILVFTFLFHVLMLREGQEHSWITGFYWTLTVMSTLGFGDITFQTDLGRGFSIVVLLSGMVFLLVLLPFTFIEFFYDPWMRAQTEARTPKGVDPQTKNHVVITNYDWVTAALIRRLESYRIDYVIIAEESEEALRLQDYGLKVAVGELDDPETYQRVRVDQAALVVATTDDVTNANVAFTVRHVAPQVQIAATVNSEAAEDILQLAGCNHVLRLEDIMARWFAARILGGGAALHVIEHVEGILVAEASAFRTPLVGKSIAEIDLQRVVGVMIAGVYERGKFEPAQPETKIQDNTVLLLVGDKGGLARYNRKYSAFQEADEPVVILGAGRVGRATARALGKEGHDYRLVEKDPGRIRNEERYIEGDAADLEVLRRAGIETATSIIITTSNDDMNIYLTLYCRKLREDAQIIARASNERHVATLHRAGADFVMSYASTGATTVFNLLKDKQILMVAEGLDFFRAPVPEALAGTAIGGSGIRENTGCTVVAVSGEEGMQLIPGPEAVLPAGSEMLLVATTEGQERFLLKFGGRS